MPFAGPFSRHQAFPFFSPQIDCLQHLLDSDRFPHFSLSCHACMHVPRNLYLHISVGISCMVPFLHLTSSAEIGMKITPWITQNFLKSIPFPPPPSSSKHPPCHLLSACLLFCMIMCSWRYVIFFLKQNITANCSSYFIQAHLFMMFVDVFSHSIQGKSIYTLQSNPTKSKIKNNKTKEINAFFPQMF